LGLIVAVFTTGPFVPIHGLGNATVVQQFKFPLSFFVKEELKL
jgi:hypothetical protein